MTSRREILERIRVLHPDHSGTLTDERKTELLDLIESLKKNSDITAERPVVIPNRTIYEEVVRARKNNRRLAVETLSKVQSCILDIGGENPTSEGMSWRVECLKQTVEVLDDSGSKAEFLSYKGRNVNGKKVGNDSSDLAVIKSRVVTNNVPRINRLFGFYARKVSTPDASGDVWSVSTARTLQRKFLSDLSSENKELENNKWKFLGGCHYTKMLSVDDIKRWKRSGESMSVMKEIVAEKGQSERDYLRVLEYDEEHIQKSKEEAKERVRDKSSSKYYKPWPKGDLLELEREK